MTPTPRKILSTLLPATIHSAKYARYIQKQIRALEEKEATNIFQAALTDADLTIQAQVEVSLLAEFPEIPFHGEEYKSSRNTHYLKGTNFIEGCDYLITLDPIDGTRVYLDGQTAYQVILTVCSREQFEGVLIVYPVSQTYLYALRGQGVYQGTFETPFDAAEKLKNTTYKNNLFVDAEYKDLIPLYQKSFDQVYSTAFYDKSTELKHFGSMLKGEICGGLLSFAQIIDSAAMAFIAQENGCIVQAHDGSPMPRPVDHPSLVLPGLIIGSTPEVVQKIKDSFRK